MRIAGPTVASALFGGALLSTAMPIYDASSTALAIRSPHTDLIEFDKRIDVFGKKVGLYASGIDAIFQGAACVGTTCIAYSAAKAAAEAAGASFQLNAGFWTGVIGGGLKLLDGVASTFLDHRAPKRRDLRLNDPRAYDAEFEPFATALRVHFGEEVTEEHHEFFMGERDDCELSSGGKYGHLRVGRVKGKDRTWKLRKEYFDPVKRAPGSIEAYITEGQDNGYPPDNGWLDEAANIFAEGIDRDLGDNQALCMRTKNYANSEAFWYMAVDGDDTDDQFTSVVGCDQISYD